MAILLARNVPVVWVPGRDGSSIALRSGQVIRPSYEDEPVVGHRRYQTPPECGVYELVGITQSGNDYFAWQSNDAQVVVSMPGVMEPTIVQWREANRQGEGMVSQIEVSGLTGRFMVFSTGNDRITSTTPWPERTVLWNPPPEKGEVSPCWLGWRTTSSDNVVAYACPSNTPVEISVEEAKEWFGAKPSFRLSYGTLSCNVSTRI